MAKYTFIVAFITIILQMNEARNIKSTPVSYIWNKNPPPYITYDELQYILKSRHGEDSPRPKHLTPCARAILGCCNNNVMNENCSESLKCGAYFFDDNPCEERFILEALVAAKKFYEQFNNIEA
ncbi:unnamed protein product [Euphydryas editha]|uniref:Uncharacterized protein n=1 Tax=Euphydryas editha TaxID=104508 RepID=A0AAU9V2G7_EUPED|nr:unnamed protein product [Euphydryas editha]